MTSNNVSREFVSALILYRLCAPDEVELEVGLGLLGRLRERRRVSRTSSSHGVTSRDVSRKVLNGSIFVSLMGRMERYNAPAGSQDFGFPERLREGSGQTSAGDVPARHDVT